MICAWKRLCPYQVRLLPCLCLAPEVLCFALALDCFHPGAVLIFLFNSQSATNVSTPCLGKSPSPVTEASGGNAIKVKHIPTCIIILLAVTGEAMQLPVWFDQ